MTERTEPRRLTDTTIAEHRQALYASADGRPASNHTWLAELLAGLEWERAKTKKLEKALREVATIINDKFESYNVGDRPQSPPAYLIELSAKVDAIVAVAIDNG